MPRFLCHIAVFLIFTAGTRFRGESTLVDFSRSANAALLLYGGAEHPPLLVKGDTISLDLGDTSLSASNVCCVHHAIPALSSDGKRLAYVRLVTAKPRKEVITIYDIGERTRTDVFSAAEIWGVAWSPDGSRLAAIANSKGVSVIEPAPDDLYVINLSPSNSRRVTHGAFEAENHFRLAASSQAPPSWNAMSNKVAFETGTRLIAVWDMNTDKFYKAADGTNPSWSPVEDVIAYFDPSSKNCFSIKYGSYEPTLLFSGPKGFIHSESPLLFPVVWSLNADRLLFHQEADENLITDLYEFDLSSKKSTHLGVIGPRVVNWRRPTS